MFSRRLFATCSLVAVIAGLVSGACSGSGGSKSDSGIEVVATTTQIGALTRAVAGDTVRLTTLLPAGADAHDYEPNPQAVTSVHDAKLVLRNGIGLDDWLNKTVENAGGDAQIVVVTKGIQLLKAASGAEAGEDDPHVWQDPENVKVMVNDIVAALSEADPTNAATFKANGDAYNARLDDVDAQIRQLIDSIPPANRKMVTNHDAFGYFIARYGMTYVGAVFPVNSKEGEVSAKDLANLADLIKAEGVKAVFAEEEVDPKVATELAKDTGVTIVTGLYADSLGPSGSGADTVDGMLLSNARKITEALK
jgi:ABC-type Zn uptake system ZnuABC Zn-binding protein ZnuA